MSSLIRTFWLAGCRSIFGAVWPTVCPMGRSRMRKEIGRRKSTCGLGVPEPWVVSRNQFAGAVSLNCHWMSAEWAPVSALASLTCERLGEIDPGAEANRKGVVLLAKPG